MELKKEIASIISPDNKTFLYGPSPAQYIYSSLKSANPKKIGYMFPHLHNLNYYLESMKEKSSILLVRKDIDKIPSNSNFKLTAKSDHFVIFKKN